ncbi:hypothetical protein EDC96DRAFT_613343 [Choanephora cucurbitarum]|nr:hypothetical protein EDC96DRAFT_613343 [Choanephora cucurbitarum]
MSLSTDSATSYQGFRPKLIEFHGYEGEDFRYFKHTLNTFFSITGINSGSRRLTILVSQLRRAAATFYFRYLKKLRSDNPSAVPTYEEVFEVLHKNYITPALVQRFELAFNDMSTIPISIHPDEQVYSNLKNTNSALDAARNACKSNLFSTNQNINHRRVRSIEPEIEQLTAKLRTLEQRQLKNASDSNGRAVKDELRSSNTYNTYDRERFNGSARNNEDNFPKVQLQFMIVAVTINVMIKIKNIKAIETTEEFSLTMTMLALLKGFYRYQDNRGNNTHSDRRNPDNNPEPLASNSNGQLSSNPTKSINRFNYINPDDDTELYAARMTQPPTVSDSRLNTDNAPKRVSKPSLKAKERAESVKRTVKDAVSPYISAPNPVPFTQPTYQAVESYDGCHSLSVPTVIIYLFYSCRSNSSSSQYKTTRRIRTKADPSAMNYDIADDVLKTKANIAIGDLIVASSQLKRQLLKACRTKGRKLIAEEPSQNSNSTQPIMENLAFISNQGEPDTTAMYADFYINNAKVPVIIDTGAARTCMSKALSDKLNLEIDAPSNTVFTMGNGMKQPALGVIYDVPINAGGHLIVPSTVEAITCLPFTSHHWNKLTQAEVPVGYFRKTKEGTSNKPPLVISAEDVTDSDVDEDLSTTDEEDFVENDEITDSSESDYSDITDLNYMTMNMPVTLVHHTSESTSFDMTESYDDIEYLIRHWR